MAYRIKGLDVAQFAPLMGAGDDVLAANNAMRVIAGSGAPCRITLEDAELGEPLILLNHVSHDVATPFRASHGIYIRESAREAAVYTDRTPPVFKTRTLSLRAFDADGMLVDGVLAAPGQADAQIRAMFWSAEIAYIHAHNAAYGCFAAVVKRH